MNPEQPNRRNQPPAANNPLASGAIIAVSILAATAFAVYESPEVRQFAENLRRQIARSLRHLGDNIDPANRRRATEDPFSGQPLFNRPEDAENVEVDADEESARRQREELEHWNKLHESQRLKKEAAEAEAGPSSARERRSSFGDFLQKDQDGEYVYKSGAEAVQTTGLTQRRGINSGSAFGNPFSDEHGIEMESQDGSAGASGWLGAERVDLSKSLITPPKEEIPDDIMSDGLYSASERPAPALANSLVTNKEWEDAKADVLNDSGPIVATADPLIDLSEPFNPNSPKEEKKDAEEDAFGTSAHIVRPDDDEAFAAIHAWNENASTSSLNHSTSDGTVQNFYSMPTTPKVSSESGDAAIESVSDIQTAPVPNTGNATVVEDNNHTEGWSDDEGMTTPKTMGSMSIIGDQESFGGSEDGRHTPGSWTEVGSQVSGDDMREPTRERL